MLILIRKSVNHQCSVHPIFQRVTQHRFFEKIQIYCFLILCGILPLLVTRDITTWKEYKWFESFPKHGDYLVHPSVECGLRNSRFHGLQHLDYAVLAEIQVKLGVKVEPGKTRHKTIILQQHHGIVAVVGILARDIKTTNLVLPAGDAWLGIKEKVYIPYILASLLVLAPDQL